MEVNMQNPAMERPPVPDELGAKTRADFLSFMENFTMEVAGESRLVYMEAIMAMKQSESQTLNVNVAHVHIYDDALALAITSDFYHLLPFLNEAVREFVGQIIPAYLKDDKDQQRDFNVSFHSTPEINTIRDLNTAKIGQLITIKGTVVRTSAVHPELISGTFQCKDCRTLTKDVPQQFRYSEPIVCRNPACENRNNFKLIIDQSRFGDFQKLRAQESSDEIPSGAMPRSVDIILRHETVERAKAGDKALFTGTLIVVPDVAQLSGAGGRVQQTSRGGQRSNEGYSSEGVSGLKALGMRDLTYKLAFLASSVVPANERAGVDIRDEVTPEDMIEEMTEEQRQELIDMKDDPQLYQKLVNSLAPNVYGHDEVKKGILLMLFGGVHKTTSDRINLRGDINICIVGDPSTSKSQFLKYVTDFVPRAIYTSGKASSAAGLTAAVVKDEDSNEFFIEAGALMLADNGICCIDEFDKMDPRDQVAIHEAMEQQTISITKAGIQATLNARTSILAAANPIGGRYDTSKTLKSNVAMTGPIMSRFDLFFVIVDECDAITDARIAEHITFNHFLRSQSEETQREHELISEKNRFTTEQVQRYIRFARCLRPRISDEAERMIVDSYRKLRQSDSSGVNKSSYRITVRQLESLVRLSEALARMNCSDEVRARHVKEAAGLLRNSVLRVNMDKIEMEDEDEDDDIAAQGSGEEEGGDKDSSSEQGTQSTKHITVSFDKYRRIAGMIVRHLRNLEEVDEDHPGLTATEIQRWYAGEQEHEFQSVEQMEMELKIVKLCITRLVRIDHVLLELSAKPKLAEDDDDEAQAEEDAAADDSEPLLVVHPNYVPES